MQMSFAAARQHMIDSQIRTNKVIDDRLLDALRHVPREAFVPDNVKVRAYVDDDLPLGNGRYLTEPMVVARLLQVADVKPTDMALVAAAGSGYAAALLSKLANTVIAVEADHALSERAAVALQQQAADNVVWQEGDPAAGFAKHAPYDVILIDGGAETVPAALLEQLAEGGRLVTVLLEGRVGRAVLMMKERGSISRRVLFDANVPLLSAFAKPAEFSF